MTFHCIITGAIVLRNLGKKKQVAFAHSWGNLYHPRRRNTITTTRPRSVVAFPAFAKQHRTVPPPELRAHTIHSMESLLHDQLLFRLSQRSTQTEKVLFVVI